jgi:parallel beta-helix repeat protein
MACDCRFLALALISITFMFFIFSNSSRAHVDFMPSFYKVVHVNESIQEAINNATDGDTIVISSGVHVENYYPIVVNKSLNIIGEDLNTTIIDGNKTERGIFLVRSSNVTIGNLTIQNTTEPEAVSGIHLYNVQLVEIFDSVIKECGSGIQLTNSTNCAIVRNNVTSNHSTGVYLHSKSSYNVIVGNFIANNPTGLRIPDPESSNNKIFHNSFVNNTTQQSSIGSYTSWDNNYPSGGNYWSDHSQTDLCHGSDQNIMGSDGLVDENYKNIDRYPLVKPPKFLCVYSSMNQDYYSMIITNSSILSFYFNPDAGSFINFTIQTIEGTAGFCRISIPKSLLWIENGESWYVVINETVADPLIMEDASYTYFYFTYEFNTQIVMIQGTHVVPEFTLLDFLLVIAALSCGFSLKKYRMKKSESLLLKG